MTDLWFLEQDTWTWVDDNGFVREKPTGWASFQCSCGDRSHGKLDAVSEHARAHIAEYHPSWPLSWWAPEGAAS